MVYAQSAKKILRILGDVSQWGCQRNNNTTHTNMNAEKLNDERTLHWLKKTVRTSENLGSGSLESYARQMVAQRYDELKVRAKELGIWEKYCEQAGWSPDHDGYDLFA